MIEVQRLIERAAPSDKAILILAKAARAKNSWLARSIAIVGGRKADGRHQLRCLARIAAGKRTVRHEKGAFTGAIGAKAGLFEVADGGTLFIDEIGELPGSLQAKLLRVLEDGSLRRIGSVQERRVNVRLLSRDKSRSVAEVEAKRFREDLFYRINVMSLELPPLRNRHGDISLLVRHSLEPIGMCRPKRSNEWSVIVGPATCDN